MESSLLSVEPSDRLLRFPCMASLSLGIPIPLLLFFLWIFLTDIRVSLTYQFALQFF
jgi:hypothetical protein